MSNMATIKPHPDGKPFGPNSSGKYYLSLNYHRSQTDLKDKSLWHPNISREMEYNIFCTSDSENWEDENGHYWGLHDHTKTQLGTKGEIICKFPHPSNRQDPWHGYPLHTSKDRPSDSFVKHCWRDKEISRSIARRIVKGLV